MPAQCILGYQALTEQSLTIKDMGFCLKKKVQHSAVLQETKLPGNLADLIMYNVQVSSYWPVHSIHQLRGACAGILLTWQGTINLYNRTVSNYVGICWACAVSSVDAGQLGIV